MTGQARARTYTHTLLEADSPLLSHLFCPLSGYLLDLDGNISLPSLYFTSTVSTGFMNDSDGPCAGEAKVPASYALIEIICASKPIEGRSDQQVGKEY